MNGSFCDLLPPESRKGAAPFGTAPSSAPLGGRTPGEILTNGLVVHPSAVTATRGCRCLLLLGQLCHHRFGG